MRLERVAYVSHPNSSLENREKITNQFPKVDSTTKRRRSVKRIIIDYAFGINPV
jgi:hypothetical protein